MTSPRIASLADEVRSALADIEGVRAVYLFGSALTSETPADIDVLVVYGPPLAPLTAPTIRPSIESAVSVAFGLPAHVMFFSEAEACEAGLVASFNPLLLHGEDLARPTDSSR
jgi:predicted nucleotidyltransferase